MTRTAGTNMSANVLALSQENLRFLSCHGQIKCKANPPMETEFSPGRAAETIADGRRDREGLEQTVTGPAGLRQSLVISIACLAHTNRTAWIGGKVWVIPDQLSPWSSLTHRPPVVEPNASRSPVPSIARAWR